MFLQFTRTIQYQILFFTSLVVHEFLSPLIPIKGIKSEGVMIVCLFLISFLVQKFTCVSAQIRIASSSDFISMGFLEALVYKFGLMGIRENP